jgi:isoquinoline 1-oxidoreductase alpha subunit
MPSIVLQINGACRRIDVPPETPLLWALRDALGLTGTKYGCGAGHCGGASARFSRSPASGPGGCR